MIPKAVLIYLLLSLGGGEGKEKMKSNAIELSVVSTLLCAVFVFSLPALLGLPGYLVAYICAAFVTIAAFHLFANVEVWKAVAFAFLLFVVDLIIFGLSFVF
jgi:hypothetical protein